ncbi:putative uncharacterized protein [Clostridium sp. CAG:590]|nr:putative uncharacterized protein [Clostridium sp. CAG:590]
MKNTFGVKLIYQFYHSSVKAELKRREFSKDVTKKIANEHKRIVERAKDIGNSKLLSSYIMGSYFIALNRSTGRSAEENYEIFRDGLCASKLFHKVMGDADSYLDPKRMPGRLQWSEDSHKRKYENDWVVDILPGNDEYDLGYDYHECGICKLCQDEGCPELAAYLCRMDYVLADIMHMELVRTGTIAEGASYCDFRYSRPHK